MEFVSEIGIQDVRWLEDMKTPVEVTVVVKIWIIKQKYQNDQSEGGLSNASARLGVQDGAERGRGGGKPRLPHGKKSKNFKRLAN